MFKLTVTQFSKLDEWVTKILKKGIEKQKKEFTKTDSIIESDWELGYPYTGVSGGQFTYSFTPTAIGNVITVKDAITGEEIDLTDYDSW